MSCLWLPVRDSFMALWVTLAETLALSKEESMSINAALVRSRILQDLECKQKSLEIVEMKMEQEIGNLLHQAKEKKKKNDISGARQKLLEKRGLMGQIERLRSSQHIIAMHLGTIKGAELNQTLISTLKASNLAIKALDPAGEITQIEDFMYDLEDEVKKTSLIGDVLAKPIPSPGNMEYTQSDLESELDELLLDPWEMNKPHIGKEVHLDIHGGRQAISGQKEMVPVVAHETNNFSNQNPKRLSEFSMGRHAQMI